ncbi:hypothetical protein E2C01_011725 [Portunus trituberculatus]|uniref:Uncharacterized protein n=1 Tax=Portunus trituberculatus TaxID=210409 RepID=A0A5B7DBT9_PORTR|nr:hypothetical protein [Portunus trituberculatus]
MLRHATPRELTWACPVLGNTRPICMTIRGCGGKHVSGWKGGASLRLYGFRVWPMETSPAPPQPLEHRWQARRCIC